MNIPLRQRGRACIDFTADLGSVIGPLSSAVRKEIQEVIPEFKQALDERLLQVEHALSDSSQYYRYRQLLEWMTTTYGATAIEAFEDMRDDIEPTLLEMEQGPTTLVKNAEGGAPSYWTDVEIHCMPGGWNGHEHMGFIHSELIHKRQVAKNFSGSILKQRSLVLEELPRTDYRDIFEMGASSGLYTNALSKKFPQASITACDLSLPMLRQALRVGNQSQAAWRLLCAPMEDSGLPGASFDLVTSFIVLHEIPPAAAHEMFAEAMRLLRPGGQLLMSDIRPYRDRDALDTWHQEFSAINGGEPYWRDAAQMDYGELARGSGFVDVKSYGLGEEHYPWITIASKPE